MTIIHQAIRPKAASLAPLAKRASSPGKLLAFAASILVGTSPSIHADDTVPAVALSSTEYTALEPLENHPYTSASIVDKIRQQHYVDKPLDDAASSEIFDKYLAMLDPGRAYFLASDVQEFEKYRYVLDNSLKRGDLQAAFEIYNRYQHRAINRTEYLMSMLEDEFDFDFTLEESIEIDRSEAAWLTTQTELDDLWRKRLKSTVLGMKLNDKPMDEIRELLIKRYKNRLRRMRQTKSEDAFQVYVNAFAATYDPHTQYFSPRSSENFNINMSLSLEGIGAVLRTEDEYTSVVRIVPAGPADKTGLLHASDRIISVGQGLKGALIDVVGMRLDDVVQMIRGPKGSMVRLEIIPADGADDTPKVIEIERNTVRLEEQSASRKIITIGEGQQARRIGIIDVPMFYADFQAMQRGDSDYRSTTRDVKRLIDELRAERIDGLVIDLRNNGGGSLNEAHTMTGLFIKSGPTVQVKPAKRKPSVHNDNDKKTAWDGPLAVLVNRLSASASEIFAGAIQDYERGLIIGNQTFGKGTVQSLIPLGRGQLKMTQAKFYRVSGQSTQHQGVVPDIAYPQTINPERVGESAHDGALAWDVIQAAKYKNTSNVDPLVVDKLRKRHEARVIDDPEFDYLRAIAQRTKENAERTHLSLNEAARIAQKEDDDAWRLNMENALLTARGEEPVESIEALNDRLDAEEAANDEEEEEFDAVLQETGNILADFIGLSYQVAMVDEADKPEAVAQ